MPDPESIPSGFVTREFSVEGMHCASCVALIEEVIAERPGVASVSVELDSGRATIAYAPEKDDADQLGAAISELGYPSVPIA